MNEKSDATGAAIWAARMYCDALKGLLDHLVDDVLKMDRGIVHADTLRALAGEVLERLRAMERYAER